MSKKEFKSFAELYTNIIRDISNNMNIPVDIVLANMSVNEANIKQEYEKTLIMDAEYYIKKYAGRV